MGTAWSTNVGTSDGLLDEGTEYLERGVNFAGQGNFQRALEDSKRALQMFEAKGDCERQAKAHANVGDCLMGLRRHEDALAAYNRSLELSIRINHPIRMAHAHWGIANYFETTASYGADNDASYTDSIQKFDEAMCSLLRAHALFRQYGDHSKHRIISVIESQLQNVRELRAEVYCMHLTGGGQHDVLSAMENDIKRVQEQRAEAGRVDLAGGGQHDIISAMASDIERMQESHGTSVAPGLVEALPSDERALNNARALNDPVVPVLSGGGLRGLGDPKVHNPDLVRRLIAESQTGDAESQVKAMLDLAEMYEQGRHVKQDFSQAFAWFEKAGKHGSLVAVHNVGCAYMQGKGVKLDRTKAIGCFQYCAERDHAPSWFRVGCCYFRGCGVTKNVPQAIFCLENAAAKDDVRAYLALWEIAMIRNMPEKALQYITSAQQCGRQAHIELADLSHGDVVVGDLAAGFNTNPNGGKAQHWALYDAECSAFIERTGDSTGISKWSSSSGGAATIMSTPETDFVAKYPDGFRKVVWDMQYNRYAAVERARDRVGESGYNVLQQNCEHFVIECVFNISISLQAAHFETASNWPSRQLASMLGNVSAGSIIPKGA